MKLIKITYLVGILVDGAWAIILGVPELFRILTDNRDLEIGVTMRAIFIIAASLMLGWTFLLAWGYRRPVERRFVLFITAFPVVFGIFCATILGVLNGNMMTLIFSAKTLVILILMMISFIKADRISKERRGVRGGHTGP